MNERHFFMYTDKLLTTGCHKIQKSKITFEKIFAFIKNIIFRSIRTIKILRYFYDPNTLCIVKQRKTLAI